MIQSTDFGVGILLSNISAASWMHVFSRDLEYHSMVFIEGTMNDEEGNGVQWSSENMYFWQPNIPFERF